MGILFAFITGVLIGFILGRIRKVTFKKEIIHGSIDANDDLAQ